jgi:hypothetical protein
MVDSIRRKILKTGAAATVIAAARRVFGQQIGQGGATMSLYAPFASPMRRPVPASRCCSFPAGD